jgi:ABC-type polysaccharide/polyol phosphate transport system ATPase subunit
MRPPPVIVVRNVSKKFRLFASPKERFLEALHPFRKQYHHEFWALRDISLEVERGEIVGILGRNGSGKSTLLQIICAVMQATSGEVQVNGRIAALLELGAGFNPEFTGRDNIILNGAIVGLSRKEIFRRLPEIEAFADIGEFFDQPVKTYSSGMFVRVAFAAAIHVDPDILVVDEALAVGDAKFQRKCLQHIEKIRTNGAAILFVSHSLETITSLCSRAIILENGTLIANGEPKPAAEQYLSLLFSETKAENPAEEPTQEESLPVPAAQHALPTQETGDPFLADSAFWGTDIPLSQRFGYNRHEIRTMNGGAAIIDYAVMGNGRPDLSSIVSGTAVTIFVKVQFTENVTQPIVGFELKTDKGVTIAGSNTYLSRAPLQPVGKGEVKVYQIDFNVPLNEGDYFVDLGVAKYDGSPGGYILDVRRSIIHLMVIRIAEKKFDGIVDIGFRFAEVGR